MNASTVIERRHRIVTSRDLRALADLQDRAGQVAHRVGAAGPTARALR